LKIALTEFKGDFEIGSDGKVFFGIERIIQLLKAVSLTYSLKK
jgi:hypothetical protein